MSQLNELGFYTLAGAPRSPAELFEEVPTAESLGLGSAFISERFNIKEAVTLSGAVGAVSRTLGVATAATNHNTRHPAVTRLLRHDDAPADRRPVHPGPGAGDRPAVRRLRHPADHHCAARGHRRPSCGACSTASWCSAMTGRPAPGRSSTSTRTSTRTSRSGWSPSGPGPWPWPAGSSTWWSSTRSSPTRPSSAASEACATAAEQAGRDPASVRIWSCYATVHDGLPEALRLSKTVGRLATYLQGYGDLMVRPTAGTRRCWRASGPTPWWRACPAPSTPRPTPRRWSTSPRCCPRSGWSPRPPGPPERCAKRVLRQFDLGVDGVIMHGATPAELAPVVEAYRVPAPGGPLRRPGPQPRPLTPKTVLSDLTCRQAAEV